MRPARRAPGCRRTLRRLACVGIGLAALAEGVRAQPVPTPRAAVFDAAVKSASGLRRLHSLLVSWRGTLLVERYFNGAHARRAANIKSASKSVISALVGIAIDRKLIDGVGQPVASHLPELLRARDAAARRTITIEDLLTMRAGLESTSGRHYGEWVRSANWVRFVIGRPLVSQPGTTMEYSTGNTHLLSAILTRASGRSTWQFAQEHLAKPLGFTLAQWTRDPQGVYFGGNEMLMTPRQMVAFGEMFLNRGRAAGRQVVPAQWVEASWVPRAHSRWSGQAYGYGWWIRDVAGHRVGYAWGYGGQYIFVVPTLDLVVVATSSTVAGDERRDHRRTIYDIVARLVIETIAAGAEAAPGSARPR